jgi:DNA polymerase-3 subunit delta
MAQARFTFYSGDDDFLLQRKGAEWFAKATADVEDDMSKELIEGRAGTVDEVENAISQFCSAAQTLSLFGGVKVVWFKGINFLADSVTGRAEGTANAIERLQSCLETIDPQAVRVLLTACPVDRRRAGYKWFVKAGESEHLALGKDAPAAMVELARTQCKAAGVEIEPVAAEVLAAKINYNSRMLIEEVEKLITYVGTSGERITESMVIELVPNYGEGDFFEAAEVFFTFRVGPALEALDRYFFTHKEARPLLANLMGRNRLMIQLRALIDAGALNSRGGLSQRDLEEAKRHYVSAFGEAETKSNLNVFTQHPFYLSRLADSARKVPQRTLIAIQLELIQVFQSIIDRPNEQHAVLREFVIRQLGSVDG